MTATLIILSILFAASAGISKAFADLSDEGKLNGNQQVRHKHISASNKWKNGDKKQGEKFFGSSKWFVSLTDTWHRADLSRNFLLPCSGCCVGCLTIMVSPFFLFGLLVNHAVFAGVFHIFHTYNFLKSEKYKTK